MYTEFNAQPIFLCLLGDPPSPDPAKPAMLTSRSWTARPAMSPESPRKQECVYLHQLSTVSLTTKWALKIFAG